MEEYTIVTQGSATYLERTLGADELLDEVEPAIATVENLLPDGFPEDVATSILTGISLQARELRNQPST